MHSSQGKTIPALTGIRFFAALSVFIYHYGASAIEKMGAPQLLTTFLHNGYYGVGVFFILSGFILSHSYSSDIKSAREFIQYITSRAARLYPVYFLALILSAPLLPSSLDRDKMVAVLLLVQSWTSPSSDLGYAWVLQAWTLSVEFFFYLFFPLLAGCCRRLGNRSLYALCAVVAGLIGLCGATQITPDYQGGAAPDWLLHLPIPLTRMGEFLYGVILQTLASRSRKRDATLLSNPLCLLMPFGMALTLLALSADGRAVSTACLAVGLMLPSLYLARNGLTDLLGNPILEALGKSSYALYILQFPLHAYAVALLGDRYGKYLALPLSVVICLLVWRFFEEPARRRISFLGSAVLERMQIRSR